MLFKNITKSLNDTNKIRALQCGFIDNISCVMASS